MKTKAYPKYKPSGVEWLGDVPEHWEVKKLKQTMSLITKKSNTETQNVALENIESWSGKYIPSDTEFDGDGVTFQVGDILFGKLRPYLAKAYLAEFHGAAVGDFHVMRPIMMHLHGRYILYLILNKEVISLIDGSTFGAKMPRVNWEFMANIPLPLPTLPEQQAIAAFLDHETGHIDTLIAKKKKLLSLLAEQRTALISRAVTKGLNPSVKLKPSGVEWLGDVPEHWEVKKIRHMFSFRSGGTPSTDNPDYWDGEIPWISSKDMKSFYIVDSEDHINQIAIQESATNLIPSNTLVIVMRSGILIHSIPACVLMHAMAINQDIKAFLPTVQLLPAYYARFIECFQKQLLTEWRKEGATVESLDMELIKNFQVPRPPLSEQHAIAAFLDRETAKIDTLSAKVLMAIERLREYRTALISAAVTGKIDVRDAV